MNYRSTLHPVAGLFCLAPVLVLFLPGTLASPLDIDPGTEAGSTRVVASTADDGIGSGTRLKIPPLLKIGDVGDRVREIQATLNKKLGGEREVIIQLPERSQVGPMDGLESDPREMVRQLLLNDGRDLRIRGNWKPCDQDGHLIDEKKLPQDVDTKKFLLLPKTPLLVDGVYGQHTYSGVLMFQLQENLQESGEVDAVTLDKLEPMVPPDWLLAGIMNWLEEREFFDKKKERFPLWIKRSTSALATVLILLASFLVHRVARKLASAPELLAKWLFEPRASPWFEALIEKKVFVRAAHLAPALFIYFAARFIFPEPDHNAGDPFPYLDVFPKWYVFLSRFGLAYTAFIGMWIGLAYVSACDLVFTGGQADDNPVKRITRATNRLVVLVGAVLMWSALAGKNPMYFVGGLGALMAIIVLIFRGYILGLVASIQIVANKTVEIGDWIEMPKHGADGDVLEITLTTVKVRNFDKSVSTIPTHTMLSESFRNWTEMERAGGRRIKRSIFIDMHSIKVCSPEMIKAFEKIELIGEYIRQKTLEIAEYNNEHEVDASRVNSRRLTNIGTFRAYLEAYLAIHPGLRGDFTHLVRQLQPSERGLPIELYVFCSDTDWASYESVQADLFDHLLAILPEFELRAFQEITSLPGQAGGDTAPGDQEKRSPSAAKCR